MNEKAEFYLLGSSLHALKKKKSSGETSAIFIIVV